MEKISGGHAVVRVLEAEGVKKAFCVPGESYLGVIDGLYAHPTIELITTRHEGGASFMAEAYAKASGDVGVCMATRGPGATNLSIGLHTAMQDSTPVVALIGQVERPFIGKEAFQEVDFQAYFSHLCKWAVEIDDVARIPELLHRAFYVARSGRPGPVVVSLPHDMLEDMTEDKTGTSLQVHRPIAPRHAVQQVLNEIDKAEKPIVIAGGGVIQSEAQKELAEFAEKLSLPVVSAFRRFNVLDNHHANYAGWLGFGMDSKLIANIRSSDLVIVLGSRLSQVSTQDYTLFKENQRIIQIDIAESSIGKAYEVEQAVVSDVKGFLEIALDEIGNHVSKSASRDQFVQNCHNNFLTYSTPPGEKNTDYAEMNVIMKQFAENVPEKLVITSDAGNFHGWLGRYYRFTDNHKYVGPTSGAMGYGLPSALGVKAALPDHTVISFSGDGGFMMTIQELETAVRANLKVIAIVVNNHMFGTIRAHQEKQFPGRVISTPLTNPSFANIAKEFGCEGATVRENDDFLQAFQEALNSDKPYVIEILTDPSILSAAQVAD